MFVDSRTFPFQGETIILLSVLLSFLFFFLFAFEFYVALLSSLHAHDIICGLAV